MNRFVDIDYDGIEVLDVSDDADQSYTYQCLTNDTVVYGPSGRVSIVGNLNLCLQNTDDAYLFPGYFMGGQVFNVSSQILLNNLITVDEVSSMVTFDFYFRVYWTDPRLQMDAFWEALDDPRIYKNGIDLTQVFGVQGINGTETGFWEPDLFFPDSTNTNIGESYLRFKPGGQFAWSRHYTIDLIQSNFNYKEFPNDKHIINLRWISYGFGPTFLMQYLVQPAVVFFASGEGGDSFKQNPVWNYDSFYGTTEIIGFNGLLKSEAAVNVQISRVPAGVVMRLGLPLFLLGVLAGLIFWATQEARFDSTVTLLLAISALYIVVFQNIPMVGYMTNLDVFSLIIFAILFVCCFVHSFTNKLIQKYDKWPTRFMICRLIDAFFRIVIIPLIIFIYFLFFGLVYGTKVTALVMAATIIYVLWLVPKELHGIRKTIPACIDFIESKADDLGDVTFFELFLYNLYRYKKISISMTYFRKHQALLRRQQAAENGEGKDEASINIVQGHVHNGDFNKYLNSQEDDDASRLRARASNGIEMDAFMQTNPMQTHI